MTDILLFVPRIIWEILQLVWKGILALWDLVCRLFGVINPAEGGPDGWIKFIGILLWVILAISLRKHFGGILKSMLYMALSVIAGIIMFAINPIGLLITLVVSALVGFGAIYQSNTVYLLLGLMWAGMLIYKVMA